jgi:hypothetical protein
MALYYLYLDTRKQKKNGLYPLKIILEISKPVKSSTNIALGLDLAVDQWDKETRRIINHPQHKIFIELDI